MFSVKREERPDRLDPASESRMNNGHEEANGEYEFTRKISNSFAESIMASSPTKVLDNNEKLLIFIYVYFSYRLTGRWEMVVTPGKGNRWKRNTST